MVSVFIYKPQPRLTTEKPQETTMPEETTKVPSYLDILSSLSTEPNNPLINSIFETNSVIISGNSNEMIDVTQRSPQRPEKADDIQYNSKTMQKFTVVHDKPKSKERSDKYTEEAKIQVYAMTGIISCMMLVILVASTYFMVQKRKERQLRPLKSPGSLITTNPLMDNR